MWFTCHQCHRTYTWKSNLRRHINSAHMDKNYKCDCCNKNFKRKEYLNRHMTKNHSAKNIFSNMLDCVSMENTPTLPVTSDINTSSSSVDDFLNSLINEDDSSSILHVPTNVESELQTNALTHQTLIQMESVMNFNCPESVDKFLDNLASEHLTSTVSLTEQPDDVDNHHNSYDISHPSTDASTSVPSGKYLVNQGSQTDICSLPSMREPIHIGTNTTPIFRKDKCQQF